jgi:hypothetical protein
MKAIELIAVGTTGPEPPIGAASGAHPSSTLLEELAPVLARTFGVECRVRLEAIDALFAFDPGRNQYHSTAVLQQLERLARETDAHLLGVTPLDLYVPVLTFVFGEAQLEGRCALVSLHRSRCTVCGRNSMVCRPTTTWCTNGWPRRPCTNWVTPSDCATAVTGAA